MVRQIIVTSVLLLTGGAAVHVQSPATTLAGPKETKELNLTAYAELLRSDLRTQKVAIITEVVGFTEAEDKAFWPIYREYDLEMAKLYRQHVLKEQPTLQIQGLGGKKKDDVVTH